MSSLPLIVRVSIPQTAFDPDASDTEIFCVNETPRPFSIAVLNDSFITLDENGTSAEAQSSFAAKLSPGESVKIGEVKGWEWDGAVGLRVTFSSGESGEAVTKHYNLKQSVADLNFPPGKSGRIIAPLP